MIIGGQTLFIRKQTGYISLNYESDKYESYDKNGLINQVNKSIKFKMIKEISNHSLCLIDAFF